MGSTTSTTPRQGLGPTPYLSSESRTVVRGVARVSVRETGKRITPEIVISLFHLCGPLFCHSCIFPFQKSLDV